MSTRRRALTLLLVGLALAALASAQARDLGVGLGFTAGVAAAFAVLGGLARGLMALARRLVPPGWPWVARQALANLHRPHNQTSILVIALGLGSFLVFNMVLTQRTLLDQLDTSATEDAPNLVLFDIRTDQREAVAALLSEHELELLDMVPIVSMRLASVKGRGVEDWKQEVDSQRRWAFTREYRNTWRHNLDPTEKIIAGHWTAHADPHDAAPPISLEADIAERLGVTLGDALVFELAGVELPVTVGSLREVDWAQLQPNFFAVFPTGVLEQAPQYHAAVTRTPDAASSAALQRATAQRFPNVSAIDIALVLDVARHILGRVAFVVRFMAAFTIATGLVVLIAALLASRDQRRREGLLLSTLGAARRQVRWITRLEILALALAATTSGAVLSLGGSWAGAHFLFDAPFRPPWLLLLTAYAAVTGVILAIGMTELRRGGAR